MAKVTILHDNDEESSQINDLPDELLLNIFKCLPLETILSCENVCKRWNKLAQDSAVWKCIVIIYSGKPGQREMSKKNLAIITSHSEYICCLKIQYVYDYSVINFLIEQCKNLISLELVMCRVDKMFEVDILKWPKLRKISLKNSISRANNLTLQIDKFKELKYLALSNFGLNCNNCYTLLQCSHLSHIFIEKIRDLDLDFIKILILSRQSFLETLHIYGGSSVDDSILQLLSESPKLKDLAIITCKNLSDAGLLSLSALRRIEHLKIWNNNTFSELALLKTLGSSALLTLDSLSLSRIANVTPAIVDLISEHYKNLKFLALYQCSNIINAHYERQLKSKFRNIDVVLF